MCLGNPKLLAGWLSFRFWFPTTITYRFPKPDLFTSLHHSHLEVSIFQPEEKAEGFLCYFAIFELTVKTRAQQDLTQGAGDQVKHSPQALPLAKKSHFNSSHQLFLQPWTVLLLHWLMHSYILSSNSINTRTNAHRTRSKILAYACLLFRNFGTFTERED